MAPPDRQTIRKVVNFSLPKSLSSETGPLVVDDHAAHVVRMTEWGQTGLAADHISNVFPAEIVARLNQMEDFRRGYEINSELKEVFETAGIDGDFGAGGLEPGEWPEFGPVRKTIMEFRSAYDAFQKEMVWVVRGLAGRKKRTP